MKIEWKKGSGNLLLVSYLCLIAIAMLYIYMTYMEVLYAITISNTRTDAVADSAAVYAQSYDYNYNKAQGEIMADLITTYNDTASAEYKFESTTDYPEKNTMVITGTSKVRAFFKLMGVDYLQATTKAEVKSVDIYGDILVVSKDIAEQKKADATTPIDEAAVDVVMP